jgi:hypothetical protein
MTPKQARRPRLGMTWFALALGALALLAMSGLAAAKDRNHDRIPDRWEKRHKLSLNVNQARHDQDGDHLRNRAEFLAGDDPRAHDSDDDGVMDGEEQAGTISSFDAATGRLVIDLFGTDAVSGLVTDATEIKCEDEHSTTATASSEGSGSGEEEPGDDNGGQGEEEPADDHGEDGVEVGDDNGGDREGGDDNSGPGSENSGPGHEGDDDSDRICTTAELVPGAVIKEAELRVENGRATFHDVELSGRAVVNS